MCNSYCWWCISIRVLETGVVGLIGLAHQIRLDIVYKGPRFSIRVQFWILPSDTDHESDSNAIQIKLRIKHQEKRLKGFSIIFIRLCLGISIKVNHFNLRLFLRRLLKIFFYKSSEYFFYKKNLFPASTSPLLLRLFSAYRWLCSRQNHVGFLKNTIPVKSICTIVKFTIIGLFIWKYS